MIFVVYTEHNVEEQITLSECIMHVHRTNERTIPWEMLVRPLLTTVREYCNSSSSQMNVEPNAHDVDEAIIWLYAFIGYFCKGCWAPFHKKKETFIVVLFQRCGAQFF